jgi:hypothetical protein
VSREGEGRAWILMRMWKRNYGRREPGGPEELVIMDRLEVGMRSQLEGGIGIVFREVDARIT